MAKNTFKTIVLDVRRPDDIERAINTARKLAKNVTIGIKYEFQYGLEISVKGPRDQIKIFEHRLLDAVPLPDSEEAEQEFIDDDEDVDDQDDNDESAEDEDFDDDMTPENGDVDDDDPSDEKDE